MQFPPLPTHLLGFAAVTKVGMHFKSVQMLSSSTKCQFFKIAKWRLTRYVSVDSHHA